MQQWEYDTREGYLSDEQLNKMGLAGWQLVGFGITTDGSGNHAKRHWVFMRPLQTNAPRN